MPYFKPKKQKINELWYPIAQTLGQIPMEQIINRLTEISTVSKSDVKAVMGDLAHVLNEYMDLGYSVKLEGLGSFYYTADASKQGVPTEKEVSASQIVGTRVRFIPEYTRGTSKVTTRALAGTSVKWKPFPTADKETSASGGSTDGGGSSSGGGGNDDGNNPL